MNGAFSNNLARLRKERKLTQEKLAETLGVSFQAVSKWETAQTYPDIELFPRLAEILATSIDSLLGYVPTKRSVTNYQNRYKYDGFYWGIAPNRICYEVMRLKPPTTPLRLLDICCGEGKDVVFFANNGYVVSAFDLAESGLDKGRKLAELNGCAVGFFTADVRDFTPDDEFDIIYTSGGLLYFAPEQRKRQAQEDLAKRDQEEENSFKRDEKECIQKQEWKRCLKKYGHEFNSKGTGAKTYGYTKGDARGAVGAMG